MLARRPSRLGSLPSVTAARRPQAASRCEHHSRRRPSRRVGCGTGEGLAAAYAIDVSPTKRSVQSKNYMKLKYLRQAKAENNGSVGHSAVIISTMRDDFPLRTKRTLAQRVGNRCSRPECRALTSGPQRDPTKAVNVGVAAHITAASGGGPRFDPSLSASARASIENAIWLCQSCAKLADSDPLNYTAAVLRKWKQLAEDDAARNVALTATATRLPELMSTELLSIDVEEATLTASCPENPEVVVWSLWVQLYLTPLVRTEIDIPFRKVSVSLSGDGLLKTSLQLAERKYLTPKSQLRDLQLPRIIGTTSELTVRGPGGVALFATTSTRDAQHRPDDRPAQCITLTFLPVHAARPLTYELQLLRATDSGGFTHGRWVFPATRVNEKLSTTLPIATSEPSEWPFPPLPRPRGW